MRNVMLKILIHILNWINFDEKKIMNKFGVITYYVIMGLSFVADILLAYSIYLFNA